MRLWSLHPRFLDVKGLVALWREGLLARQVLLGRTRGYQRHPQLLRFRASQNPVSAINAYLSRVYDEAVARGYRFDVTRIEYRGNCRLRVTEGQLAYEWEHLLRKLQNRDPVWRVAVERQLPRAHPCFRVVPGPIEEFERVKG